MIPIQYNLYIGLFKHVRSELQYFAPMYLDDRPKMKKASSSAFGEYRGWRIFGTDIPIDSPTCELKLISKKTISEMRTFIQKENESIIFTTQSNSHGKL